MWGVGSSFCAAVRKDPRPGSSDNGQRLIMVWTPEAQVESRVAVSAVSSRLTHCHLLSVCRDGTERSLVFSSCYEDTNPTGASPRKTQARLGDAIPGCLGAPETPRTSDLTGTSLRGMGASEAAVTSTSPGGASPGEAGLRTAARRTKLPGAGLGTLVHATSGPARLLEPGCGAALLVPV